MKKIFILMVLCIAYTSRVFPTSFTEAEIILFEIETSVPLDDCDPTKPTLPPTRFRATISGHDLSVSANTNKTAHLIVENNSKGDIVEDKPFTSSTTVNISKKGNYTLYIISDDTAVIGEFNIE